MTSCDSLLILTYPSNIRYTNRQPQTAVIQNSILAFIQCVKRIQVHVHVPRCGYFGCRWVLCRMACIMGSHCRERNGSCMQCAHCNRLWGSHHTPSPSRQSCNPLELVAAYPSSTHSRRTGNVSTPFQNASILPAYQDRADRVGETTRSERAVGDGQHALSAYDGMGY